MILDELGGRLEWMMWFGQGRRARSFVADIEDRYSLVAWLPIARIRAYGPDYWNADRPTPSRPGA